MRWSKVVLSLVVILLIAVVVGLVKPRLSAFLQAMKAPELPPLKTLDVVYRPDAQNWTAAKSERYHHLSQGSRTLNIPLSWFMALEEPAGGLVSALLTSDDRFADPGYLGRFGFLTRPPSEHNPEGLPIGFATTPYQSLIGIKDQKTAIGFTCAACHTGQLVYKEQRFVFDGAGANIDLGQFTVALGAALGQTLVSSQVPILNGRFERFAANVLGDRDNALDRVQLITDLENVVKALAAQPQGIDVTEGFSRLDALNRIGNMVFAIDPGRFDNYVNINAPVNFPHIWTSSWFSWVQYDGSIMQPLIRNVGEAMGTAARTDFVAPIEHGRFSNTIPIDNLHWIENALAGEQQPFEAKAFGGLHAPVWPEEFPPIDPALAADGHVLYDKHCKACHLPALTRAVTDGSDKGNAFWDLLKPVEWEENGEILSTSEHLIDVQIVHEDYLGTDAAQAAVLKTRTVNTAADANRDALGVVTSVCTPEASYPGKAGPADLTTVSIEDDPSLSYALALGAVVQRAIEEWMEDGHLDDAGQASYWGDRPNCLQGGKGYKARPLNGIWATGPFLHNGSVPTLEHLLGDESARPGKFLLGETQFDVVNVGLVVEPPKRRYSGSYTDAGYFVLDTSIPGNSNKGHAFDDERRPGVIGPALSAADRAALIEFLKTL
jgi:mono/diheme cytochrome c family protein